MRIIIDARFYGTEHTGLGRYTKSVLKYLPKALAKHELYVLLNTKYMGIDLGPNVKNIECNIPHYSLAEQVVLPRLIASLSGALFYAFHFNVPTLIKIPFVVTIHDLIKSHFKDDSTTTHGELIFRLKRFGYERAISHAVKSSRDIIVPTNTVKNDILALVPVRPEKIHVVYESTFLSNSKIVNSKLKIPPNYLLFIGNAYPHKNLALLLAALGSIPKKYSLVVVSKKTEFLERVLQSADLSLLARVQLQENVDDQGLAYLYQNARLTVTPSLMEGFGLPGLESLSVGTPVVASDIPAFREVYGNHVSYFDPLSAASLVRAINHTLKNSTRSNFVWNQTWARAAQEIAGVLG